MLDYLSDDALVFIEDAEELALVVDELETQARTLKRDLTDVGDLPSEWPDPYFGWSQLCPRRCLLVIQLYWASRQYDR